MSVTPNETVVKFIVNIRDGRVIVTRPDGTPVESGVYGDLRDALAFECRQQHLEYLSTELTRLCREASWVFPESSGNISHSIRNCVYFFSAPRIPGGIKIGKANHLANRIGDHRQFYGRPLVLRAVAIHPEHVLLEQALHAHFEKFRIRHDRLKLKEWFDAEAVTNWLAIQREVTS